MSTTTRAAVVRTPGGRGPSLARLVRVELRKAADTRSGSWLLLVIGLLAAATVVVRLVVGGPRDLTLQSLFVTAQFPVVVLLPVLAILTVTSEWSQRTAITTFALVPQRSQVVAAKSLAAVLLALLASLATVLLAAVGVVAAPAFSDGDGSWVLSAAVLSQAVLVQVLTVVVGVGFGLLLLSSPLAIVAFFVLPTLFTILTTLVSALTGPARWLDFSAASAPLIEGILGGRQWAHLASSFTLWALLPLALGTWRVARADAS